MPTEQDKLQDLASLSISTLDRVGSVEVLFAHSGPPASGAEFHIGLLHSGIAMAGDGLDLGNLDRDFKVTLFDPGLIDQSSIDADYTLPVETGSHTALFLTWATQSNGADLIGLGLEISYEKTSGFNLGPAIEAEKAMQFMSDSRMTPEKNLQASTPTVEPETHYFTELSVSGYRGFAHERRIQLAKPNHLPGSGLTILVGANNSGKSTFLEALHSIAQARESRALSFPQPRRHRELDSVAIELTRSDGRTLKVETVNPGGSQARASWNPEGSSPGRFDIQVTPSRRQFSPYFGSSGSGERNWGLMDQEFSRTQLRENFVSRLRKVDQDPIARDVFDALLTRINGKKLDWTIDEMATNQQFLKLIEPDGTWHTSEGLGDGLVSLLFIVDALYDSEPGSLIAIDEPELSLHPQLVRRLRRELSAYASDRQIVIATHSPLLIDWGDIANGATVARVYKVKGSSEIAQASDESLQKVAKLSDSRNFSNPHTVGTVAREAFFLEDGIVLTEGQDDAAYLPVVLEDLELPQMDNIYGWGSGGVGNIPTLAQLFRELGFLKIGAILDDDGQKGTLAAVRKLQSMGPEVLVRQIPAPDIRYKKANQATSEVVGLMGRDNHVRADLKDEAIARLTAVLDHVSSTNSAL